MLELSSDEVAAIAALDPRPLPLDIADVAASLGNDGVALADTQRTGDAHAGWESLLERGLVTSDEEWSSEMEELLTTYCTIDRGLTAFAVETSGVWQRSLHGNAAGLVGHTEEPSGIHTFVGTDPQAWGVLSQVIVTASSNLLGGAPEEAPLAQLLPVTERVVKIVGYRLRGPDHSAIVEATVIHAGGAWLVKPDGEVARRLTQPDVDALLAPLM